MAQQGQLKQLSQFYIIFLDFTLHWKCVFECNSIYMETMQSEIYFIKNHWNIEDMKQALLFSTNRKYASTPAVCTAHLLHIE